jgi:hypothetical protein
VAKARQLEALAAEEGIELRITTGYRSPAEQERLYAQGRTTPGAIVTYAKPGASRHQHGTAIDIVPLKDGQPDWNSPHWDRLGALGEGLGLRWGGKFTRLKDRPHFELAATSGAGAPARSRAPATPRDWGQELFATPARTTPPSDRSTVVPRIVREARRQGVDPDLAVAVATQESSLDPGKVGDNGKSLGLFQLQEAAAIDAGIDPRRRGDLTENIRGGVGYLKLQLAREGGNVARALSRYNRGTPTYQGRGDPDYVAHVMQYYPPAAPAAQKPAVEPRDWGQELFATDTPVRALSRHPPATTHEQMPAPGGDQGARDWGQELFATATALAPRTVSAPAPQTDWGPVLLG